MGIVIQVVIPLALKQKIYAKEIKMEISYIRNLAGRLLSFDKFKHVIGVEALVRDVAPLYGISVEAACLAAVAHDLAKDLPIEEQKAEAQARKLIEYPEDLLVPQVLHGRLAALKLQEYLGAVDQDILNAIAYHTTGRPGMSPLEMLIYTADCAEPERSYPGVDKLREKLYHDLVEATLAGMEMSIANLQRLGKAIHPLTRCARDFILEAKNKEA